MRLPAHTHRSSAQQFSSRHRRPIFARESPESRVLAPAASHSLTQRCDGRANPATIHANRRLTARHGHAILKAAHPSEGLNDQEATTLMSASTSPITVLVHGAFADASRFTGVIRELGGAGQTGVAHPNA